MKRSVNNEQVLEEYGDVSFELRSTESNSSTKKCWSSIVMARSSPTLESMLSSSWRNYTNVITFESDLRRDYFSLSINLYHKTIEFDNLKREDLFNLLVTCREWLMYDMIRKIGRLMNSLELTLMESIFLVEEDLPPCEQVYILRRIGKRELTHYFNENSIHKDVKSRMEFMNLSNICIEMLYCSNLEFIVESEETAFYYLFMWFKLNEHERRDTFVKVLYYINFGTMQRSFLMDVIGVHASTIPELFQLYMESLIVPSFVSNNLNLRVYTFNDEPIEISREIDLKDEIPLSLEEFVRIHRGFRYHINFEFDKNTQILKIGLIIDCEIMTSPKDNFLKCISLKIEIENDETKKKKKSSYELIMNKNTNCCNIEFEISKETMKILKEEEEEVDNSIEKLVSKLIIKVYVHDLKN